MMMVCLSYSGFWAPFGKLLFVFTFCGDGDGDGKVMSVRRYENMSRCPSLTSVDENVLFEMWSCYFFSDLLEGTTGII